MPVGPVPGRLVENPLTLHHRLPVPLGEFEQTQILGTTFLKFGDQRGGMGDDDDL